MTLRGMLLWNTSLFAQLSKLAFNEQITLKFD
jgi:hypothetical protein